jgi:predicted Na+-dependent transporter
MDAYALFEFLIGRVSLFQVLLQVGEVMFLPVIAGLLNQRFVPRMAASIARPVQVIANALLLLLLVLIAVILAITPDLRQMYIPTVLAYMLLGGILAFPYSAWCKRQIPRKAVDRKMVSKKKVSRKKRDVSTSD